MAGGPVVYIGKVELLRNTRAAGCHRPRSSTPFRVQSYNLPMGPQSLTRTRSFDEAVRLAQDALRDFAICFWTRQPNARLETRDDVLLVVRRLRQQGAAPAWRAAADIEQCL
jgi:hypothetical protein